MHAKSAVAQYAVAHPDTTELLESGKLRFTQSGMDFPATASQAMLEHYAAHGLQRALRRRADGAYDFAAHLPYVMPHPDRNDRHFVLCKLTGATLPRSAEVVARHTASKRFIRLRTEAEKRRKEREELRQRQKANREKARKGAARAAKAGAEPGDAEGGAEGGDDVSADGDGSDDHMRTDEMAAVLDDLMSDSADEGEGDEEEAEDDDEAEGDGEAESDGDGDDESVEDGEDVESKGEENKKRAKKSALAVAQAKAASQAVEAKKKTQQAARASPKTKRGKQSAGANGSPAVLGKRRVQISIPRKMRQARNRRRAMDVFLPGGPDEEGGSG